MNYYDYDYSKLDRFGLGKMGVEYVKKFLDINGIHHPDIRIYNFYNPQGNACGMCDYRRETVEVWAPDVAKVALETTTATRRWSYPGYKVDRTAIGVLAHEVGHWVDRCLRVHRGFPYQVEKLTSYEPDRWEAAAESLRLFILNPCLLYIIAPRRCEHIISLGIKPLIDADWDEVLRNAPDRYKNTIIKNYLPHYGLK